MNQPLYEESLPHCYRAILYGFRKVSSSFIAFNFLFLTLLLFESAAIWFSYFWNHPSLLALTMALLFLTAFTYCILFFYYQTKKPEQLERLKERFVLSCRQTLHASQHGSDHLVLADSLSKLSSHLPGSVMVPPVPALLSFFRRFSTRCYREDVFRMQQLLLTAAIEEHLKQVRLFPTDLETHASLANHYIALAKTYRELFSPSGGSPSHRIRKMGTDIEERIRTYLSLALEEFKVLQHFAPHDPWVHEQLAIGYRELHLPKKEIEEWEQLLALRPNDLEIVFRLGVLYFQEGESGKGLRAFETLQKHAHPKANLLIEGYGKGTIPLISL